MGGRIRDGAGVAERELDGDRDTEDGEADKVDGDLDKDDGDLGRLYIHSVGRCGRGGKAPISSKTAGSCPKGSIE